MHLFVRGREASGRVSVDIFKDSIGSIGLKELLLNTNHAEEVAIVPALGPTNLVPYESYLAEEEENLHAGTWFATHVESPSDFYIMAVDEWDRFEEVFSSIQDMKNEVPPVEPGARCRAKLDEIWYRVKVLEVSPNQSTALVLYIDVGWKKTVPVRRLRSLDDSYCTDGLVRNVSLSGVQPTDGRSWSENSVAAFKQLMDAENGKKFTVDWRREDQVELVSLEGLNVGAELVEKGLASYTPKPESAAPSGLGRGPTSTIRGKVYFVIA